MQSRYSFLRSRLDELFNRHEAWERRWAAFETDDSLRVDDATFEAAANELFERLTDNYPFFHPHYAGQMLKPPHQAAVFGYLAAMLINPNNHALDGGPATGGLEKEVVADLARLFGYESFLGHLTSSGTIANLEALWIGWKERTGKGIAFSSQSHYTHRRMCEVLGIPAFEVTVTSRGAMDIEALKTLVQSNQIGTVVVTLGTTGVGALDPLHEVLELRSAIDFRIHVDAAYGGFFALLADENASLVAPEPFRALRYADSIVVDPHKHGLQPYGCGCVLFNNPAVGRHYKHDSPYTYFTSGDLHLGEISLECSRAGAAAAALWLTLKVLPLTRKGLGGVLEKCRRAALRWAELLRSSEEFNLLMDPELDIVVFFPKADPFSARGISRRSDMLFQVAMNDEQTPVYLSKLRVPTAMLRAHYPGVENDAEWTTVLRSSLMKPEHFNTVPEIHATLETFCRRMPVSFEK